MLIINIDLHSARTGKKSTLAKIKIVNDGITSRETQSKKGSYNVIMSGTGRNNAKTWKEGRVENFPRKNKNVYYLLQEALNNILNK